MVSPLHDYIPGCYNDPKTPTPVSIGHGLSNGLVVNSRTVCTILTSDRISDSHVLRYGIGLWSSSRALSVIIIGKE